LYDGPLGYDNGKTGSWEPPFPSSTPEMAAVCSSGTQVPDYMVQ